MATVNMQSCDPEPYSAKDLLSIAKPDPSPGRRSARLLSALLILLLARFCAADLVAHYDFDEPDPALLPDKSGNGNNGKINGAVEFVKVGGGQALRFDGKSTFVDCGAGPSVRTESAATVMCWFNPDPELQGGLVTRSTSGSWADQRLVLSLRSPGGEFVWALADGTRAQFHGLPDIRPGTWKHIALTFNESRVLIYRNGKRAGGEDQTLVPNLQDVPLIIGRSIGLGDAHFKGLIDEVRLYSRALSEQQIAELYESTKAGRGHDDAVAQQIGVDPAQVKYIEGSAVSAKAYQMLLDERFLPARPPMSDFEMAETLNLDLPALAEVKQAYDAKDAAALERALAGYLRSKMGAMDIKPTGQPPRQRPGTHATNPDDWLGSQITVNGFEMRIGNHGEEMNFYSTFIEANCGPGIENFPWVGPLTDAYIDTGDEKYAVRMLDFTREFYRRCRPPAARRDDWPWGGGSGPWSMGGSQRASGNYLPYLYRVIGNSPAMTDADRVMFLKMFWEHLDLMGQFATRRVASNFGPAHLYGHIVNLALYFPEFRDTAGLMQRVGQGFSDSMEDCVLDDGGTVERTGYNFGYIGPYVANYVRLQDTPYALSETFRRGLERNVDFSMWVLAPTLEYPMFGTSSLGPMDSVLDWGVKVFPQRADFAYALSGGKIGEPPRRLARVLPHTGWLTMRSSWQRDALYMAMNYNGSPDDSSGTWENLNSFAIWANGWPYMTDAGSTASYSEEEYYGWCEKTFSCNTVLVDKKTQGRTDNGGRLESWSSLPDSGPGFTYLAAVSDAYRRFGVAHRRAVFFARPDYWLMYDVLSGDGKPHRYHWQGHFQPADVVVEPASKIVCATPENRKPIWLIPARPETFEVQQTSGPIVTRVADPAIAPPLHPHRQIAPYVSLEKSDAVEPFAFAVLICPSDSQPAMESLPVTHDGQVVGDAQAVGVRVRRGEQDDLIVMSPAPALRQYGPELATDAEAACVRRDGQRIVEAAMVNGRSLEFMGTKLIQTTAEIDSVHVRFVADAAPQIHARGRGQIIIHPPGGEPKRLDIGSDETVTLTPPQFATAPRDLARAIGLPNPLLHKDMVVVTWQTPIPTDAVIECNGVRRINPESTLAHRFVLSPLKADETYSLRITCRGENGATGTLQTSYTHRAP